MPNASLESWAADEVRRFPVASLVPYARNARTHSVAQVNKIAASIREFGWTMPLLIDADGSIIAGHGRVMAAQKLGIETIPCMVADGWSDAKKRAYRLADNRLALDAGWDAELLKGEFLDLEAEGFDLSLTGFDVGEIAEITADQTIGSTDPDDVPSVPDAAVSRPGDIWLLGAHRVMCGDSTDRAAIDALCAGEVVDCVWSDPPYNVNYKSAAGSIQNDHQKDADFRRFLVDLFSNTAAVMKPGAAIYVAHADTEGLNFRAAFSEAGFKLSSVLVWVKPSLVLGRSDYQWRHEPVLYGWKPGAAHRWYGGRSQTTVADFGDDAPFDLQEDGSLVVSAGQSILKISGTDLAIEEMAGSVMRFEKPRRSSEHPTMKPVELISLMLGNSARPGSVVLDPCAGSGSTLIACDMMGARARAMELEPRYCDVIVRRWQDFAGKKAVLAGGPMTFAEVAQARG